MEEKLLKVPDFSFFGNDWNILQAYLKSKGNPRYYIDGNLDLHSSEIKSLGNLVRVDGWIELAKSKIESLENLEYVGGWLNLKSSSIIDLGNLKYIGGGLDLRHTPLLSTITKKQVKSKISVNETIFM
jgi:hypothetical protein